MKHYLIAATILLFGLVYFATNRYELVMVAQTLSVLRDRWTGELGVCQLVKDPIAPDAEKHVVCSNHWYKTEG